MFSTIGYLICIPFAWLVRLFYNLTGSYGVAIILFTLVLKMIMLPFQMKSKKSMMRMSRMSGRLQEIQKKYANNQTKQAEEMQKLYAEEGVSPMSGCLWSFLPLPILLALYSIIRQPITHFMMLSEEVVQQMVDAVTGAGLDVSAIVQMKDGAAVIRDGVTQLQPYGQINLVKTVASQLPEVGAQVDGWINVNYNFLGLDMAANPWDSVTQFAFSWAVIGMILIPILAGGSQILLTKITMKHQPQTDPSAASANRMMMFMPLFSIYIAFMMPAALGLYWIAQSAFSAVQEFLMGRFFNKKLEEEENARYEARQAERKKKMEEAKVLQEQQRQQTAQKQTLKEKQQAAREAKAAKAAKAASSTTEAGRVGDRPYARGRAYKPDRYDET
ncbi:YidC/Oxa1 family membrane protein insertase [uncultured Oscillibacter sp.]|mgnify:CR=1 FL=1|uniref:YidC/Oxa1 family membrane protein insertase n=1 Tax=uncultured Oscillibacter sp. TaxID=876091 RepID=UPI0025F37F2F|nr:YidC/Oxa1 family membrane protein insertase [uncultured Oscillibacter sp.]